MSANSNLLTPEDVQQIKWGNPIDKAYYIILSISYDFDDERYEPATVDLIFRTASGEETTATYTAKIPAGLTLSEAMRGIMLKDFNYTRADGTFFPGIGEQYDTITESGITYSRMLAHASTTHRFSVENIEPYGMELHWGKEIHLDNHDSPKKYPVIPMNPTLLPKG
jgi:hypothetical protein